ncbi:MAG: DoxX family protein [Bacteriovoracia bacterium]
MLALKFLGKFRDLGLLILRFGLGVSFILHGSQKMFGGPEMWTQIGGAMGNWGMTMYPVFWGFMAAFAEFAGGFLFILGFLFRPAAILLTITMACALTMHVKGGDGFKTYSHALEVGVVFLGLIFVGPGKFSIDRE